MRKPALAWSSHILCYIPTTLYMYLLPATLDCRDASAARPEDSLGLGQALQWSTFVEMERYHKLACERFTIVYSQGQDQSRASCLLPMSRGY
jgi:hypothetical protein